MNRSLNPSNSDKALSEGRLLESVRSRGSTRDGLPAIWGHGFAARYPAGGREGTERARPEPRMAPRAREAGVAA